METSHLNTQIVVFGVGVPPHTNSPPLLPNTTECIDRCFNIPALRAHSKQVTGC